MNAGYKEKQHPPKAIRPWTHTHTHAVYVCAKNKFTDLIK